VATIYDVAERAQVSIATVSRAFRRPDCVSEDVRERVRQAADDLGYRPNRLARALAEGRTNALGLLLPFYGLLAEHVARCALELGYEVVITPPPESTVESYVEAAIALEDRQIEGLLLCGDAETVREYAASRRNGSPPLVAIGSSPEVGVPLVTVDEEAGGYEIARYVLSLGHREVAFLCLAQDEVRPTGREHGYVRAMTEAGLEPLIHQGPATLEGGRNGAREIIARAPTVTALVSFNDAVAMGALRGLFDSGRHVPGDVAVVGFDNTPQSRYCIPALTTMDLPVAEVAERAVGLLRRQIDGGAEGPAEGPILVDPHLVRRESCGGAGGEVAPGTG